MDIPGRIMVQQLALEDMFGPTLLSDEEFTEFEAWFDEFFETTRLSDEELTELEALLYPERAEQQALIDEFFEPTPFVMQRDGIQGWLRNHKKTIPIPELHKDLREFHTFIRPEVMEILENDSRALGPLKFKLEIAVRIIKETIEGIEEIKYFTVQREPILKNAFNPEIVTQHLDALADAQEEALANRNQNGSGFVVDGIEAAFLRISNYDPLPGGSYIPLPKFIKTKGAVINVKNKDDECLRWTM